MQKISGGLAITMRYERGARTRDLYGKLFNMCEYKCVCMCVCLCGGIRRFKLTVELRRLQSFGRPRTGSGERVGCTARAPADCFDRKCRSSRTNFKFEDWRKLNKLARKTK